VDNTDNSETITTAEGKANVWQRHSEREVDVIFKRNLHWTIDLTNNITGVHCTIFKIVATLGISWFSTNCNVIVYMNKFFK